MKNYLFLLILFAFFVSCNTSSNKGKSSGVNYQINLDSLAERPVRDSISKYSSELTIVPLETNDESIISTIAEMAISEDRIYVADYRQNREILSFDLAGNFIQSIGGSGKGPGEYVRVSKLDWNAAQEALYVLDAEQGKIIRYNDEGRFESEFIFRDSLEGTNNFVTLDNGNYLLEKTDYSPTTRDQFVRVVTPEGEILKTFFNEPDNSLLSVGIDNFRKADRKILYAPLYSNVIYVYNEETEEFNPYIQIGNEDDIDLKRFKELQKKRNETLGPEGFEVMKEYEGIWDIRDFFETESVIFINYNSGNSSWPNDYLSIDKDANEYRSMFMTDDLIEEHPTWSNIQYSNSEYVIKFMSLRREEDFNKENKELILKYAPQPVTEEMKTRIDELSIESNPVLIMYKINKP